MLRAIRSRWFLISLAVLIAAGLTLGARLGPEFVETLSTLVRPRIVTAIVLFLMSFSLDSARLGQSLRSPGPVGIAFGVNFGLIPLMGWGLMAMQSRPDFAFGLMIACSVPCTMAAASVWTRKAGGNDAVSLLVTATTNGLCFVITPFWLNLTTTGNVSLDFWEMFRRLLWAVLVPTLMGQAARLAPPAADFAKKYKTPIGVAAQACILTIVFSAACKAGVRLGGSAPLPGLGGALLVWGTCIAVHLAAMGIGVTTAVRLGSSRADRIAVAFAASQKTLPVGVLIATDAAMFGNPDLLGPGLGVPFAVFPMLLYHASQLFIDTAIADRFRRAGEDDADSPT